MLKLLQLIKSKPLGSSDSPPSPHTPAASVLGKAMLILCITLCLFEECGQRKFYLKELAFKVWKAAKPFAELCDTDSSEDYISWYWKGFSGGGCLVNYEDQAASCNISLSLFSSVSSSMLPYDIWTLVLRQLPLRDLPLRSPYAAPGLISFVGSWIIVPS